MAKFPKDGKGKAVDGSKSCIWFAILYTVNSLIMLILLIATLDQITAKWASFYAGWSGASALRTSSAFLRQQDDPVCLSRTQQWTLRAPSRFYPIPSRLAEEWKIYGDLHKRCSEGKNWSDFFRKVQDQVDDCKYLIYLDGIEGIGNRLLSLATAWIYALTNDRVLLVDNRRKLNDLLCEPFPKSSWILPDDFPYKQVEDSPSLRAPGKNQFNVSNIVKLYLRHDQSPYDSQFFCPDVYDSLTDVRWIGWSCNNYYIPNMILVPSFWQQLTSIFPDPDHVYALISRLLFLPSNEVWALVLQEYRSYLASSKTRVGVQIRLLRHGSDPAVYEEKASKMIMDCLVKNNFLPEVAPAGNDTQLATMNARKLQSGEKQVEVGVLVASLQGKYYQSMKDLYSHHAGTTDGRVVRVHSVSNLGQEDESFLQSKLAFVEILMLSFSDLLATSGSSTFGYTAQSWGNVLPLIMEFGELNKVPPGDICARGMGHSVEPCTHNPHRPTCLQGDMTTNLSTDHKQWMLKHLHYCQDRPFAWQLVQHNHKFEPVFKFQI